MSIEPFRDEKGVEYWTEALHQELRALRQTRWRKAIRLLLLTATVLGVWKLLGFNFHFWWIWMFWGGGAAADNAGARVRAASALVRSGDPRAVSALAIAYHADMATRGVAGPGLKEMLPRLRASDAAHITPEGMKALLGLLRGPDYSLTIAVLNTLQQVGDARAIPAVEAVEAETAPPTRLWSWWPQVWYGEWVGNPSWDEVRKAARECLPFLRERVEQERQRTTLLRAADTAPESLLRPAQDHDTPPEQLLRPTQAD